MKPGPNLQVLELTPFRPMEWMLWNK